MTATAVSPVVAAEDGPAPFVALSLESLQAFVDSEGNPIKILQDTSDPGQRVVLGEMIDGAPVSISIYSAPPATAASLPDPDIAARDAVENWVTGPVAPEREVFSGSDYPVVVEKFQPTLGVAATPTTVTIALPDGASVVSIQRDGRPVSDLLGSSNEVAEDSLTSSAEYRYSIETTVPGQVDPSNLSLRVATPSSKGAPLSAARAAVGVAAVSGQEATYTTFIPDARVEGNDVFACVFQEDRAFGGDNRTFAAPLRSSRTEVRMYPWFPRPEIAVTKHVSTTHLYEASTGQIVEERTAPSTGITFSDQQSSTTYAQLRITHSVGNPFCAVGAISYSALYRFYSSGLVEVIGTRLPAPAHESWVLPGSNATKPYEQLFGYDSEGFHCLTGICGERSTNAAGTFD